MAQSKCSFFLVSILISVFASIGASTALASPDFSLAAATNYSIPSTSNSQLGSNSNLGIGVGALLGIPISTHFSAEIGALYLQRNWTYTGSKTNQEQVSLIEVPVLIRTQPLLGFLSVGGGFYYGKYVGSISDTSTSGSTTTTTESSYSAEQRSTTDAGLVASVKVLIPLTTFRLFVDGRYTYGLSNNDENGGTLKFNDLQILLGITFGTSKN